MNALGAFGLLYYLAPAGVSVSKSMNRDRFNDASEPATRFRRRKKGTFGIIKYAAMEIILFPIQKNI
ncbi:MAG: hypothetical protein L0L57_10215 [Alkalibacterium sp.]|nr:hypothetical protein [Tetragenococcus koreensis]MDN6730516.1 hypothetical protein [Alkalibacterium sp.]